MVRPTPAEHKHVRIYKPNQGVAARVTAACLLSGLTLLGVYDFYTRYNNPTVLADSWIGGASVYVYPLIVLVAGLVVTWFITNSPKVAEHLIEAEIELKKVVWPKQSEILRATGIVLVTVVVMALLLWVMDLGFLNAVMWAYSIG